MRGLFGLDLPAQKLKELQTTQTFSVCMLGGRCQPLKWGNIFPNHKQTLWEETLKTHTHTNPERLSYNCSERPLKTFTPPCWRHIPPDL